MCCRLEICILRFWSDCWSGAGRDEPHLVLEAKTELTMSLPLLF